MVSPVPHYKYAFMEPDQDVLCELMKKCISHSDGQLFNIVNWIIK